ncbi:hypothetical protein S40285_10202 [Stachybotrys chlorohalonatus IBT 40285]|uniref:Uncharacterized protein n=1 Tax=Stachybotrys chlorohalonatus (strain IBT 40285) TaxID=1283841 RepID=A0A084QNS9_STAC4|nr:hypothetical protein S40285_10202 [Stachybotrys chlorohalonata IBT 40285]
MEEEEEKEERRKLVMVVARDGPDIGVVPAMLRLLLSRQPPQPKPEPCHDVRRMDNAPAYLAGQPQVTGPAASCSPAIDLPEG